VNDIVQFDETRVIQAQMAARATKRCCEFAGKELPMGNRTGDERHMQDIAAVREESRRSTATVQPAQNDALWLQYAPQLMAKAGVDSAFLDQYGDPPAPALPSGAREYLCASNPRLVELRRQYALVDAPVVRHSRWNTAYVDSEIPLQRFRGDCAFIWQERDLNLPSTYLLTYYYLRATGHADLLDLLSEDDLFGVYTVKAGASLVSRDRLDSAVEIAFLDRTLGISRRRACHILDIGSGYGRLAYRLTQAFENVSVTCVDAVAESTFLCEYYLRFRGVSARAQAVSLSDIEAVLAERPIDAAVNVHSFSECPLSAIRWWLDLLSRVQVPYILVVPNAGSHDGTRLLSTEIDGSSLDFRPLFEERSYKLALTQPKYAEPALQRLGVTPTHYFLFAR
jgi:SAM-dependent methyltransferase